MKGCVLKGISDQAFSRTEAAFFLTRPEMFPLCYGCKQMLKEIVKGT